MIKSREYKTEFSKPHNTRTKTAPLIPKNIKYELGLTNYKCKIPKMSLTKTPLQINLAQEAPPPATPGRGVYHPPSNPHVDLTA